MHVSGILTLRSLGLVLALLSSLPAAAADIYLVRHAEKTLDASQDPELTDSGRQRAANLANMLRSTEIRHVFSTDFRRTRDTAAPLAGLLGVEIEIYDPDELEAFAHRLQQLDANALVVGHSNTTPALVELLGGDRGTPIEENWEYDRLYLVRIEDGRAIHTILLHVPPASVPRD